MAAFPALIPSIVYALVGIVVLTSGFIVFDLLTPGKLWEEIKDKQNMAVAQFAGLIGLGLSIIVAAAIHG